MPCQMPCQYVVPVQDYLFKVFVAQLDGEEQLTGAVEVAKDPAGQDVGFV